ncbi:MAG: hypothetical protein JW755_08795 [Candidatus Aminicenantes bacterium]|nr:hypothetical protein [Candidatus Aminicenantes bacterium]
MNKSKYARIIVMVFLLGFLGCLWGEDDDLQVIKKAVKENPRYSAQSEIRWIRLTVTDLKTNRDKVKIKFPVIIFEIIMEAADEKKMNVDCDDFDIDLRELYYELKKLGPMSLIEISSEDEQFKIWLE